MKKVIAVMVIMAVFSTAVFAAPLSVAGSLDKTSLEGFRSEMSAKTDSHNDFDDLFADVHAAALTTEEAQAVEGEGLFGAAIGFFIGSYIANSYGAAISNAIANGVPNKSTFNVVGTTALVTGGIIGAFTGLGWLCPFF